MPPIRKANVALLLALSACGKEAVTVQTPGSLTLVQGNLQSIQGGQELPNPIVIRLLDTDGQPIAKTAIGFNVVVGGGAVNPPSALTDENGEAKTKWILGAAEVNQTLQVRAPKLDPVSVNGIALLPTDLLIAQGNHQQAKPAGPLPNPIVIRVVGPNNAPMKGIPVAFQVIVGGGLVSPQSALTNALGEVTVRWTLGAGAGQQLLAVSSGGLQPISLTATAVP